MLQTLSDAWVDELCPHASLVTAEKVADWHRIGFNVRAWGVSNEELMKALCEAGADGMTVNAPDVLLGYLAERNV